MSNLIKLARLEDIVEGAPKAVDLPGFPPLAIFRLNDRCYVTGNLCTHGNALLTDGYQEGAAIECPIHGGVFDVRTGKATVFPCELPLPTFAVTVEEGYVCIDGVSDSSKGK